MTVLVGVRYSKGFVVGSDRLGVCGDERSEIDKVFWERDVILSLTGVFYGKDLFSEIKPEKLVAKMYDSASKYTEFVRDLRFYFNQINKVSMEHLVLCLLKAKCDNESILNVARPNISFVTGTNWCGNNSILFYDSQEKKIRKANHGIMSDPINGFMRLEMGAIGSRDDAIGFVEEKILLANEACPQYCSGLDIYAWEKGDVLNVMRERPLL